MQGCLHERSKVCHRTLLFTLNKRNQWMSRHMCQKSLFLGTRRQVSTFTARPTPAPLNARSAGGGPTSFRSVIEDLHRVKTKRTNFYLQDFGAKMFLIKMQYLSTNAVDALL